MATSAINQLLTGPAARALAGKNTLLTGAAGSGSALTVLGDSATAPRSIQTILDSAAVKLTRTQFFNNVALRIEALRLGQVDPAEDWEKIAAFLAATGQPFVVSIDGQGQVQVDRQADTDLARYTEPERQRLAAALDDAAEIARRVQANAKNQGFIDALDGAVVTFEAIRLGLQTAKPGWETQAKVLAASGLPFKIALDPEGKLTVVDQSQSSFFDAPVYQQTKLLDAVAELKRALATGVATSAFAFVALAYAANGIAYFLDIDPVTGDVAVKANTGANVIPDFLKTPPFADVGADQPWKQQAADFIAQGKGFYLDLDSTGQVAVRANDGFGINLLDRPRNSLTPNPVVNLLA